MLNIIKIMASLICHDVPDKAMLTDMRDKIAIIIKNGNKTVLDR